MRPDKYTLAREVAFGLNRLVKRTARRRRGERKPHFEKDCQKARSLLSDPNILGFGVGPKITEGKPDSANLCLVFFVRKKLPRSRLVRLAEIPRQLLLNTISQRVQTDLQEWGAFHVAHGPLSAGASIGDLAGNAGTMMLAVQDRGSGDPLLLGCSHVLAACGNGH